MKKFLPIGILLASSLFSACDLSTQSQDASGTRTVSARVGRAADVANSVWSRTVWVRVNVSTTGKDTLKDTLVAFSAGGCPSVAAPVGDSVVVTLLGLSSDSDTALWYGSDTLLPGTRDTVDSITVHGASLPLPKLDSTSVVPWGVDTFDRPVRVHLSIPTLSRLVSNAVLRYTLDGSVPTEASLPYPDSGILVDSTRRVVSAVFGSLSGSLQRGAILSLPVVLKARPVSFSATGSWAPFSVVLSCATAGTVIHYTTDGSVPTPASPVFSAGLPYARFSDSVRYKAIAVDTLHPAVAPSAVDSQSVASIAPWNDTDTVSYGTLTDARDGQSYRTVKIGTRTWMAENLNHATDSSWCYQGDTAECTRYGRLYQWSDAVSACPVGWHLPTSDEWNALTGLADSAAAGRNLKSRGGIWSSKGTDNRGFHAMPGGARYTDGTFDQVENAAYFWTSSANGDYGAWYRDLTISSILVSNSADMKTRAFSVRCAQD